MKTTTLFTQEKRYWHFIILLTIAVFCFRLFNLGFLTLWVDEFVHANRAKFISETGLITGDDNGVLYTLCILPLFKLFGANEFWDRFPSVIFGSLTIPLMYRFCEKYFNERIGVILSILLATSLYVSFWSRIGRNYAIFMFFYMLVVYIMAKLCNIDNSYKPIQHKVFDYIQTRWETIVFFVIAVLLSLSSHTLSFFIIYAFVFYHFICFLQQLIKNYKQKSIYTGIHAFFGGYIMLLLVLISTLPALQPLVRGILSLLIEDALINWIIIDFNNVSRLSAEKPFGTFDLYYNVLKTDMPRFYLLSWVGFIIALWKYKKIGIYLISNAVFIFLLMAFIFREPAVPRYWIYTYPLFLLGIAIAIENITTWIIHYFNKKNNKSSKAPKLKWAYAMVYILILLASPIKKTYAMITTKQHGQIVPRELSHWYFVKWKAPLKKLSSELQPNDIILSTMVHYNKFYIGEQGLLFRQTRYNTVLKKYEPLPTDTTVDNAHSLLAVQKLVNNNTRGWLLADYYFHNVMTDPRTRDFIIKNTIFRYDMSNDDVKVFQWDNNAPNKLKNNILEYLTPKSPASYPYNINVSPKSNHIISVEAEGVKRDGELLIIVNNQPFAVSRSNGSLYQQNKSSTARQWFQFQVSGSLLKANQKNSIQFATSTKPDDELQTRIAVYNLYVN